MMLLILTNTPPSVQAYKTSSDNQEAALLPRLFNVDGVVGYHPAYPAANVTEGSRSRSKSGTTSRVLLLLLVLQ